MLRPSNCRELLPRKRSGYHNVERELHGEHLLRGTMDFGGTSANEGYVAGSELRRNYLDFILLLLSDLPVPPTG